VLHPHPVGCGVLLLTSLDDALCSRQPVFV
jgi:hypothetical protein